MEKIRWVGKLCLVVAIALEMGAILENLLEGESAFYLFDIAYKFSLENNFFIAYWGAILGIIFVSAEAINKVENKDVVKESNKETINTREKVASRIKTFTKGFKETFDVPEDPRTKGWKFWVLWLLLVPVYFIMLITIAAALEVVIENEDLFFPMLFFFAGGLAYATGVGLMTKEFGFMFFSFFIAIVIGIIAFSFAVSI